jgi:hypothetical protein
MGGGKDSKDQQGTQEKKRGRESFLAASFRAVFQTEKDPKERLPTPFSFF